MLASRDQLSRGAGRWHSAEPAAVLADLREPAAWTALRSLPRQPARWLPSSPSHLISPPSCPLAFGAREVMSCRCVTRAVHPVPRAFGLPGPNALHFFRRVPDGLLLSQQNPRHFSGRHTDLRANCAASFARAEGNAREL
jgi:hypothetical protein